MYLHSCNTCLLVELIRVTTQWREVQQQLLHQLLVSFGLIFFVVVKESAITKPPALKTILK